MIATATRTKTYVHHGYLIDIVANRNDYEAWIYADDMGEKHLMFGAPKCQQAYNDFLDLVQANFDDYTDLCD